MMVCFRPGTSIKRSHSLILAFLIGYCLLQTCRIHRKAVDQVQEQESQATRPQDTPKQIPSTAGQLPINKRVNNNSERKTIIPSIPSMRTTTTNAARNSFSDNQARNSSHALSHPQPVVLDCGIWVAPSVLPGAGLGMYAGKSYRKGDKLQRTGDVAVPIVDLVRQNNKEDFDFLWDEYIWKGETLDMSHEGYHDVDGAVSGFGATPNAFHALTNVDEHSTQRDASGLHRSKDPGAGAFTPYFDRFSTATRNIHAGEEFYLYYGSRWFQGNIAIELHPFFDDISRIVLTRDFFLIFLFVVLQYRSTGIRPRAPHTRSRSCLSLVSTLCQTPKTAKHGFVSCV